MQLRPRGWHVRPRCAIAATDSQPEPDIAVIRGSSRQYATRHPAPSDVGLVVEVADSSLDVDRRVKSRIYARAGIPTYWIVNLVENRVEVHTEPKSAGNRSHFAKCTEYSSGEKIPVILAGKKIATIAVDNLLPDVSPAIRFAELLAPVSPPADRSPLRSRSEMAAIGCCWCRLRGAARPPFPAPHRLRLPSLPALAN